MKGLLLDTCAAIFFSNLEPVRKSAEKALAAALAEGRQLLVSPFTAWEVGMLVSKGRLRLPQNPHLWFKTFLDRDEVALAPLTTDILFDSSFLPGSPPPDPWDKIIAATARQFGYTLVTRDRKLLAYAEAGHLNAIEC